MQPKVSVILTTYNPQEYLLEAIGSIVGQSIFGECELIVVDDESTHREYIEQAKSLWPESGQIKYLTIAHGGLSAARNAGLAAARASFLAFCDDDDIYHHRALEVMLKAALSQNADIVCASMTFDQSNLNAVADCRLVSGKEAAVLCLYQKNNVYNSAWAKLYRAGLFEMTRFPVGLLYEDLALVPRLMLNSQRVVLLPCSLYFYRQRPGSILHVFNRKRMDVLDIMEAYVQEFDEGSTLWKASIDRRFSAACNMLGLLSLAEEKESASFYTDPDVIRCLDIIKRSRCNVLLNQVSRIKSRAGALLAFLPRSLFIAIMKKFYSH